MAEKTGIEWCDSTVNFWEGCTNVSPACDNCYAERMNKWLRRGENWGPGAPRRLHATAPATVRSWQRGAAKFRAAHGRDRRVFVNSTSDWLDNEVPIEWLVTLLDTVRSSPDVTFLLLSKRIGNWRKRLADARNAIPRELPIGFPIGPATQPWVQHWLEGAPPENVWLGATLANRAEMLRDAPKLKAVQATVRFWSVEPMLGPLGEIPRELLPDWVICGGESGPKARPSHVDWFRSLREQCAAAGVPLLLKQWGEWIDADQRGVDMLGTESSPMHQWPSESGYSVRIGKAAAGRLLDGRTHDEFPA